MKIPFSPPDITENEIQAVTEVLNSGWISAGSQNKAFQEALKIFCKTDYSILMNSATAGLELALRYFDIKAGDEVITTPYTYASTVNVICRVGATPVLVDINENDFNINSILIEKAITAKTKAIISVDFAGFPVEYDAIMKAINSKKNLFKANNKPQEKLRRPALISDAAHSLGSVYKKNPIGKQADITIFSFHAVKNLTTGEGGGVVFSQNLGIDTQDLYHFLSVWTSNGRSQNSYNQNSVQYDILAPGYSFPMPDILASIGLSQLKRYDDILKKRWKIAQAYHQTLKNIDGLTLPIFEDDIRKSNAHLYPLRIKNDKQKKIVQKKLQQYEIAFNKHFIPIPMHSYYQPFFSIKDFPICLQNYESEISLPVFSAMTEKQLEYIIDSFVKVFS